MFFYLSHWAIVCIVSLFIHLKLISYFEVHLFSNYTDIILTSSFANQKDQKLVADNIRYLPKIINNTADRHSFCLPRFFFHSLINTTIKYGPFLHITIATSHQMRVSLHLPFDGDRNRIRK